MDEDMRAEAVAIVIKEARMGYWKELIDTLTTLEEDIPEAVSNQWYLGYADALDDVRRALKRIRENDDRKYMLNGSVAK